MTIDDKIKKIRDKIAKTDIECGSCGDIIKCIDIEQHVKEKHFRDAL